MGSFDTLIAAAIVIGAGVYLFRKFARTKKHGGGCGCSPDGCQSHTESQPGSHCCGSKH